MNEVKSCFLRPRSQYVSAIALPHNEHICIGRTYETLITDMKISKRQVMLRANYDKKVVYCVAMGGNISGCNGHPLEKNTVYSFKDGDELELALGCYIYRVTFEINKEVKLKKLPETFKGNWQFIANSLLIYSPDIDLTGNLVAAFDLDGTLIKTKSGQQFPKDKNDWSFATENISEKVKDLYQKGYRIVIFSNQLKLGKERQMIAWFKQRIENIIQKIGVPIQVFLSVENDIYRKPIPGMWENFIEGIEEEIDLDESFYVGDAGRREKNLGLQKNKDSISDRLFSLNLGIQFYTPEEYFLGAQSVSYTMPKFNPRVIISTKEIIPISFQQEGIMMVGNHGSGKSHFCKNHIVSHNYVYINRDISKSKYKCLNFVARCIRANKSFVIDNRHPDVESRKPFIDLCKKHHVPINCFLMTTSLEHCKHNNKFRSLTEEKYFPTTNKEVNDFKARYKVPRVSEGFSKIYKFRFNAVFENEKEEKLYKLYLLES